MVHGTIRSPFKSLRKKRFAASALRRRCTRGWLWRPLMTRARCLTSCTAIVDGTYAGILETDGGPGPKLLLVMTDGRNNASWLQVQCPDRHRTPPRNCDLPGRRGHNAEWIYRVVSPALRTSDAVALLKVMADATGGRYVEAQWDSSLGETFQQILREYRQRYILTFTPEGMRSADGWHTLEVKAKRGGALVRAHTRYWAGKE
jgi:hypothetical protein